MSKEIALLKNSKSTTEEKLVKIAELQYAQSNPMNECNCDLSGIEHDIRTNGISIAQVKQLVDLNDGRINENLDHINNLETSIGNMESFPSPGRIIFSAYKAEGSFFSGNVTYATLVENVGDGLDISTGVFTTPLSGLYMFSFSGRTYNSNPEGSPGSWTKVGINVNGVQEFEIGCFTTELMNDEHLSHTWLSHLQVNDKVSLKIPYGQMYSDSSFRITFSGYLVK